jgi:mRNA interferase HigB
MHVLSLKKLRAFWQRFPAAETPLRRWYRTVRKERWQTQADLRASFATADLVGRFTV